MKKIFAHLVLFLFATSACGTQNEQYIFTSAQSHSDSTWAVIGAGPAGITIIGLLLDLGINPSDIFWVDPEFNVGRLGQYYTEVPANTKTKLFINFLESCKAFSQVKSPAIDELFTYELDKEYPLKIIVKPLQDITDHLKKIVHVVEGSICSLDFEDNTWNIGLEGKADNFKATHVVLATGSRPKNLDYPCKEIIPLDVALNKYSLAQQVTPEDSIAVVGSSHSAILLLKFLSELKVKRIINFYKNPIFYAIDMGTWILHNSNGLKGEAACWAKEVLEKNPPANLIRLYNTLETREAWLPVCNKIIYAIGYERNELPCINGTDKISYDDHSGIIAPRLFGIGIAFPEAYTDPVGNHEHRVGLNSFMEYAQRVLPQWLTKDIRAWLAGFEQLFTIDML